MVYTIYTVNSKYIISLKGTYHYDHNYVDLYQRRNYCRELHTK